MKKIFILLISLLCFQFLFSFEPNIPDYYKISFENYTLIAKQSKIISQGENWILIEYEGQLYLVVL